MKILLIDDNLAVLEVLALMLTADGHTVVTAKNGREGLARLERGDSADLVLTDAAMPEMDGWEILRIARSRWPRIRVGLISATPEYLSEHPGPVDLLIEKPVTFEGLREALRKLG